MVSKEPKRQKFLPGEARILGQKSTQGTNEVISNQNMRKAGGAREEKRPGKGDRRHVGREGG